MIRIIWVVMFAVFLSNHKGLGGPIVFSNRTEFETQIGDLTTESFESEFEEAPTVVFDRFTVTELSEFAILKSRTDYVSDGQRALGFTWNGSSRLQFEFSPPITAFGVDILDFGTCCGAQTLDILSDTGEVQLVAARGSDLPRGNLQFFGFEATEPISMLWLSSQSLSDNDLIVFDRVSIRSVPEPTGTGILVVGWLAVCFVWTGRTTKRQEQFKTTMAN